MFTSHSQFVSPVYQNQTQPQEPHSHLTLQRFLPPVPSMLHNVVSSVGHLVHVSHRGKHNISVPSSEGHQGPQCPQVMPLSCFHKGTQSTGSRMLQSSVSRAIAMLCFLPSSVSEDHQHVKHIFMHISIWHTGLSCLGLSCFPDQLLLKTGNPISRPALRNHTLPLLRMELSQHLVTVLNHNFETLFVYYI